MDMSDCGDLQQERRKIVGKERKSKRGKREGKIEIEIEICEP
jgi:hypothetical protein